MLTHVLHSYALNLQFAKGLVKDLTHEQMCTQPGGVINHAAWNLGHLAVSADYLGKALGLPSSLPAGWEEKFKAGAAPTGDAAAYPSKEELLDVLGRIHGRISEAVSTADPATFERAYPDENDPSSYFPKLGDLAVFLMTSHEMDHLGQIAAWRRALGVGPAN